MFATSRNRSGGNTVAIQFQKQLQELIDKLNTTMPHFVRCIKPNTNKRPEARTWLEAAASKLMITITITVNRISIRRW